MSMFMMGICKCTCSENTALKVGLVPMETTAGLRERERVSESEKGNVCFRQTDTKKCHT